MKTHTTHCRLTHMKKTTEKTIKGILIDPITRTITQVELIYTHDRGFLEAMYQLLDCQMIEAVRFESPRSTLWVDEEGLFKRGNPVFAYPGLGQGQFCGKAVILGDTPGGNCTDTKLTLAEVTAAVQWTTLVAAL
jgi:hypothetical protein